MLASPRCCCSSSLNVVPSSSLRIVAVFLSLISDLPSNPGSPPMTISVLLGMTLSVFSALPAVLLGMTLLTLFSSSLRPAGLFCSFSLFSPELFRVSLLLFLKNCQELSKEALWPPRLSASVKTGYSSFSASFPKTGLFSGRK